MRCDECDFLVEESSAAYYFCPLGADEDDGAAEEVIRSGLDIMTVLGLVAVPGKSGSNGMYPVRRLETPSSGGSGHREALMG